LPQTLRAKLFVIVGACALALAVSIGTGQLLATRLEQELARAPQPTEASVSDPGNPLAELLQRGDVSQLWLAVALGCSVVMLLALWLSRRISRSLEALGSGLDRFARGELGEPIRAHVHDDLAERANQIAQGLARLQEERDRAYWLRSGQSGLIRELRGELDPAALADRGLRFIARHLEAPAAALYYLRPDGLFHSLAQYALVPAATSGEQPRSFRPGEGLVGEAAQHEDILLVRQLPPRYFRVRSGLGETQPNCLALVPLLHQGRVGGVLEIALFRAWEANHGELMLSLRELLVIAIEAAYARTALRELQQRHVAVTAPIELPPRSGALPAPLEHASRPSGVSAPVELPQRPEPHPISAPLRATHEPPPRHAPAMVELIRRHVAASSSSEPRPAALTTSAPSAHGPEPLPIARLQAVTNPPLPQPTDPSPALSEPSRQDAVHMLIIEDDPVFAEVMGDVIQAQGLKYLVAYDGESGLMLAKQARPNGIVLDVKLADTDGFTVMETLRKDPQTANIPVHFVSALAAAERGLAMSAVGYLNKPTTREDLLRVIDSLVPKRGDAKGKILVVEDESAFASTLAEQLDRHDIETTRASSTQDALRILDADPHGCLVLDLSLPDLDGLELLELLKERLEPDTSLPVVIYTGRALSMTEAHRLEMYGEAIVMKEDPGAERVLDEIRGFTQRLKQTIRLRPNAPSSA
jgi:CheY-like chemotaxis protein